jgi:hypothetical protein
VGLLPIWGLAAHVMRVIPGFFTTCTSRKANIAFSLSGKEIKILWRL